MRKVSIGLGVVLVALAAWIGAARSGAFDANLADAERRYAQAPSKFVDIDGTRIHYRDEGTGPALVLIHGSRASLHQWDGWVHELGSRYRIIRFDVVGHGLTGPDGRNDYSADRQLFLIDELLRRLNVPRAIFGGTSSGSTLALRYAVQHPERVESLLLSTVPLRLPAAPRTSLRDRAILRFHDKVLGTTATDLYWRTFLRSIYADPNKVTDELVTRYRILNTLPGQQERFAARLANWRSSGGAELDFALAGKIQVPTLVQWGLAGPVLPSDIQCAITSAFTATQARVASYPDLGHKLVLEDPRRTALDALAFLDGRAVGSAGCQPTN